MDRTEAHNWAETFENKSISELQALAPPDGLLHHLIRGWHRERDAAIKARRELDAAPETLADQSAARDDRLAAPPALQSAGNADSIALSGNGEDAAPAIDDAEDGEDFCDLDAPHADPAGVAAEAARAADRKAQDEIVDDMRGRLAAAQARNAGALPAPVSEAVEALVLPPGDAAQILEYQLATGAALIDHLAKYITRNDTSPDVCMKFMDRMSTMMGTSARTGKVVGQLRGVPLQTKQTFSWENQGEGARGRG